MKLCLKNAVKLGTYSGFGASAAWWSPRIDDDETARKVADLLYGDDGLKMNIYRYNVGGGFEADNLRMANPWRPIESFMKKDGSYDWDADKNAVRVMKYALETGNVDTLIFFANSPHFTHTVTGQTSGGFTEHFSNLAKDKYEAFAKYFIDIAEHFIEIGFPVKYISPINEPQWKWGGDYVWQEGCHYEPIEVRDCCKAFAAELERRNSPLLLYTPESGNIKDHTKEYYELLSSDELIMKHLGAFAYHSYGSDNNAEEKISFGKWARENVKAPRFDMSEWCELPCKHDTKSFSSALINARIIGEDLIYSGAESWSAWVGVNQRDGAIRDGKCYCDGLLWASDDFSEYGKAMRYYAAAHYSKYIPKGSVRLDTGFRASRGLNAFAFLSPDGEIIVVAVNASKAVRVFDFDIDFDFAQIVTSSQQAQLVSDITREKRIHIPPESIETIILKS